MRQGDARGEGTIAGFTPEDIARGYRAQPYLDPFGKVRGAMESVPVPIEVTTLYELRQLRQALDRQYDRGRLDALLDAYGAWHEIRDGYPLHDLVAQRQHAERVQIARNSLDDALFELWLSERRGEEGES